MADRNITIPYPVLKAGEKFKVRYRILPGGAFSAYQDETNTQFTLSGLTEGAEYELEIIFVQADETECSAVYIQFTVPDSYECVEDFAAEIIRDSNGLYWLEITYTPPGSQPACGWEIIYQQGSGTATIPYASLPTSGLIRISVANQSLILSIRAMICDGQYEECFLADVSEISPPSCVSISNVTMQIREVLNTVTNRCEYFLDISFTQSNPISSTILLSYAQGGSIFNTDKFTGTVPVPSGNTPTVTKKLNPVLFEGQECTSYDISVVDVCNNGLPQRIDYCRTICFHETP